VHTNIQMIRSRAAGFSLVELMVSMTLSLILLAGLLSVVYSSKLTYTQNDHVARMQEGGRTGLELMMRDLRGAGFPGCAQPIAGLFGLNNLLVDSNRLLWNFAAPLQGYEATGATWAPVLDAALSALNPALQTASDVVAVHTIRPGSPIFRASLATLPTGGIVVNKAAGQSIPANTPVIISDCGNATVFAASTFTDNGATATITLATGGGGPANTTDVLPSAFTAGAQVAPVSTVVYYIAPTAANAAIPALWRLVSGAAAEEIIPGAERLQVQYGVDTNGDTFADNYVNANAVANWSNVVSVNLALLMRGVESSSPQAIARTYDMLGTAVNFNDRFDRTVFTTTVSLRNRTI